MEAAAPQPSETNNVDVPELKTETEVNSASELTQSDKNNETSDKELSWEKIAAEIAAEDVETVQTESKVEDQQAQVVEQIQTNIEPPLETEKSEETTVIGETVINIVTEEKIVEGESQKIVEDEAQKIVEDEAPPVSTEEVTQEVPTEVTEELVEDAAEVVSEAPEAPPIQETSNEPPEPEPVEPIEVIEPEEIPDDAVETSSEIEEDPLDKAKEEPIFEISELKPEEAPEITETIDEVEYTVVEAEEVETNEIIEEHLAQTNNTTETVVIINPDESQTEITIEHMDETDTGDENIQTYTEEIYLVSKESEAAVDDPCEEPQPKQPEVKPRKQRGRKPISDIPLHVLGRDITKPTEGVSNGGRTMPKPRLGVKVPYRNLTSQIVSKEEIEKEIMERFKLKQEQNATNSGDILFARKLTQRLAKKLIPSDKDKTTAIKSEASSSVQNDSEIKNNSDLIAILEGEDDDLALNKQKQEEKKGVNKNIEKEIALQQLKELPGKNRFFKSRDEEKKPPSSSQKEAIKPKSAPASPTKVEKKPQVDVEPRLKTGMVIKTYTRKRKSTDLEPILPPKKSVVVATTIKSEDGGPPTDVYITKSSRVIKRKVIWDPDEVPSTKNQLKSPKSEIPVKTSPTKVAEKEKKEPVEKVQEKKTPVSVKKVVKSPVTAKSSPPVKKPKRLTEVDKLLMDEGAVNMLYDVKTNDEASPEKQKKKSNKSVISLDRAHKELMSKTNVIKNDLQQNTGKDGQKSLRKKEGTTPPKKEGKKEETPSAVTRKKSKDSTRSSVHSPPLSPFNAAEASRIIRRHSSSSFSSNDELDDEDGEEKVTKKNKSTESPKKKQKKNNDVKPAKEVSKNNNNTVAETKENHVDKNLSQFRCFTVTKKNKLVSISLISVDNKCYLSEQLLEELTSSLKEFGKDDSCHVVSITSDNNESFCEGLDYRSLVDEDDNARKKKATEMANLVKEFLRCLLHFPKVLVAGIQGDCVGLGVTMLPLFDMVIASDTSTFSTPYSRLGCVAEAGFLLTVPHLSSNGLASELLYTSQSVKADDAFRRGLVTRLCWPEKYQQELKSMLSQIAGQSKQGMVANKQQLRHGIIQSTESALSAVCKVLIEHWTSPECQKNFSK